MMAQEKTERVIKFLEKHIAIKNIETVVMIYPVSYLNGIIGHKEENKSLDPNSFKTSGYYCNYCGENIKIDPLSKVLQDNPDLQEIALDSIVVEHVKNHVETIEEKQEELKDHIVKFFDKLTVIGDFLYEDVCKNLKSYMASV